MTKLRLAQKEAVDCDLDQFAIWDRCYELDHFKQDTCDVTERLFAWRGLEKAYRNNTGVVCTPIKLGGNKAYEEEYPDHCNLPFCPSCWFRTNMAVGCLLETFDAPHWYVRRTNSVPWDETIHPQVMTRFRADGGGEGYNLVAWVLVAEPVLLDGFNPTNQSVDCRYYYVGLWTSERPIRSASGPMFDRRDKTRQIGTVMVEEFPNKWSAAHRFFGLYQHPSHFEFDARIKQYIGGMWRPLDFVVTPHNPLPTIGRLGCFRHVRYARNPLHVPAYKLKRAADRLSDVSGDQK